MCKKKTRYIVRYVDTQYGFEQVRHSAWPTKKEALDSVDFCNTEKKGYTKATYLGESRMLPFNLEDAKVGAKVCLDDGTPVRLICFDRVYEKEWNGRKVKCPLVGLYMHNTDEWVVRTTETGTSEYGDKRQVLFMV